MGSLFLASKQYKYQKNSSTKNNNQGYNSIYYFSNVVTKMIRVKKDQKRSSLDGISQFSEDLENEWVPMSRNQKSRKPINPTSNRSYRKSSRVQDWVNFNIKSLGDITSQDSDSGFEQSTGKSTADYHSLYIEPWTDCHNNDPRRSRDRKNCGNQ